MISFDNLPDELLLRIFSYFSQKELQTTLRFVDSRWNRLAEDSSLYREFIADEKLHVQEIIYILRTHANDIRLLQFIERDDLNELTKYVCRCKNLQTLMIKLSFGSGDRIVDVVKRCKNLITIVIQHSSCVRDLPSLFQAMEKRSIKRINIRNSVEDITSKDLSYLKNVEDLRLKSIKVETMGIYLFCQNNYPNLTTLKLITGCDSSIDNYPYDVNETIFAAIGKCENLETLCLGQQIISKMDDVGLQKLYGLTKLSTFVIHHAEKVTTKGFSQFFRQPLAKNFKKVGLYKCSSISNFVIYNIAITCVHLEKFAYEQYKEEKNNIGPCHIIMLASNCCKLRWLHLFGMDIKVAEILHSIPVHLPHLESLKYCNDNDPMKLPSFMHNLERKMPGFSVSGLQWKFSLYVHCRKKKRNETKLQLTI